jgi:hypothetical protein
VNLDTVYLTLFISITRHGSEIPSQCASSRMSVRGQCARIAWRTSLSMPGEARPFLSGTGSDRIGRQ